MLHRQKLELDLVTALTQHGLTHRVTTNRCSQHPSLIGPNSISTILRTASRSRNPVTAHRSAMLCRPRPDGAPPLRRSSRKDSIEARSTSGRSSSSARISCQRSSVSMASATSLRMSFAPGLQPPTASDCVLQALGLSHGTAPEPGTRQSSPDRSHRLEVMRVFHAVISR